MPAKLTVIVIGVIVVFGGFYVAPASALMQTEKTTLILPLVQKILEINQKIVALGGTPITIPPGLVALLQGQGSGGGSAGAAACTLERTLALGMRGEDVRCLQRFLIAQNLLAPDSATGFDGLTPSGYFGPLTRAAVIALQKAHGLESVGHVGKLTRAIVNAAPIPQTPPPPVPQPPATPLSSGGGGSLPPASPVSPSPSCTLLPAQTQTIACPTGQTGSITQTRASSCPGPTWNAWQTTGNTCVTLPPSDVTPIPIVLYGGFSDHPNLPTWYNGFIDSSYFSHGVAANVSKQFALKAFYFPVATVPLRGTFPFSMADVNLQQDAEGIFLHGTNPAMLAIYKDPITFHGSDIGLRVTWKSDDRYGDSPNVAYKVYELANDSQFNPGPAWSEWWKKYTWYPTVNPVTYQDANLYYVTIPLPAYDAQYGTKHCYRVVTVVNGSERQYSNPSCSSYAAAPSLNGPTGDVDVLAYTKARKISSVPSSQQYADDTYTIRASFQNPLIAVGATVQIFQKPGTGVNSNQGFGPLQLTKEMPMTYGDRGFNATTTIRSPYMLNVKQDGLFSEDIVYRIVMNYHGVTTVYPTDGGYYTPDINFRLRDRMWHGQMVNPNSSAWLNVISNVYDAKHAQGFNAIYFDEWWGSFAESTYTDAPSIELNPGGIAHGYYISALNSLMDKLRARYFGIALWANGVGEGRFSNETSSALTHVDGVMWEGCFVNGGLPQQRFVDGTWVDTFNLIKGYLNNSKIFCFVYPLDLNNRADALNEQNRLYGFASALLLARTDNRLYYGTSEFLLTGLFPSSINYLPEFTLPLGNPTSDAASFGQYVMSRTFEHGIITVNASSNASYTFAVPRDMRQVRLVDMYVSKNAAGQVIDASAGSVNFIPVAGGSQIVIPAQSALILLDK